MNVSTIQSIMAVMVCIAIYAVAFVVFGAGIGIVEAIRENTYVQCQHVVAPNSQTQSLCETIGRNIK